MEVTEILNRNGYQREAAELLGSILEESDDRAAVYRRMEKAYSSWASLEIEKALKAAEKEALDRETAVKAVKTAIDTGRTDEALELIDSAEIEPAEKALLRARVYMALGRPFDALMIVSSTDRTETNNRELLKSLFYVEGRAAEEICDFGRAYSAFAKILSIDGDYLDSRERAGRNYVRFLEESTDTDRVLVKCGEL